MSAVISENNRLLSQKTSLFESGVDFVGIINNKGRMIDFIGTDSLVMPKDKKEMFFMKITLRNSMQKDFDEDLGPVNYCLTQRGDAKFISLPISGKKTVFVVTKNNVDHEEVIAKINKILQFSKQILEEKLP